MKSFLLTASLCMALAGSGVIARACLACAQHATGLVANHGRRAGLASIHSQEQSH